MNQASAAAAPAGPAALPPDAPGALPAPMPRVRPAGADALREALLDSRQRWRDLVTMAADLAFETDAEGRFVFLAPEQPLGWAAAGLIGQPASLLLAESGTPFGFDPFTAPAPARGRRAWLKRPDGTLVCMAFSVVPLPGQRGVRGVGQDMTEQDGQDGAVAAALRRGEVLDHILWSMRQEVLAPRMMQAALDALSGASGAEGAAVLDLLSPTADPAILHLSGRLAEAALGPAMLLLGASGPDGGHAEAPDGRKLLACPCHTRFGEQAGLVLWRTADARAWDDDDRAIAVAAAGLVRVILEHDSIQREMARRARTDPLTGLLNRGSFLDEVTRRTDRLEREGAPGTLLFIDLDGFKQLNDGSGHDAGDEALVIVANLLRGAVRPSDLVARLGGDEFALWMDGADELTAAERAEHLRTTTPALLAHLGSPLGITLSMSIGIASRWPGRGETVDALIHRADQAMYEVKRAGRGHWRVSRLDSW